MWQWDVILYFKISDQRGCRSAVCYTLNNTIDKEKIYVHCKEIEIVSGELLGRS